jgi:hypothetical protein
MISGQQRIKIYIAVHRNAKGSSHVKVQLYFSIGGKLFREYIKKYFHVIARCYKMHNPFSSKSLARRRAIADSFCFQRRLGQPKNASNFNRRTRHRAYKNHLTNVFVQETTYKALGDL